MFVHCITIDLEDWYHYYPIATWDSMPSRLEEPASWILDELSKRGIKAAFFILGYIAERHPELVKRIWSEGHEIGIHGYDHSLVFNKRPREFNEEIKKAISVIEKTTGVKPDLFRAPSFSINRSVDWVWDILADNGISRDSSLFAAWRLEGGIEGVPDSAFKFSLRKGVQMVEYPIIPRKIGPLRIPYSGGGYFRLLPPSLISRWLARSKEPVIFYLHPRDFDPEMPFIKGMGYFRNKLVRIGLNSARVKFRTLLDSFTVTNLKTAFHEQGMQNHNYFKE